MKRLLITIIALLLMLPNPSMAFSLSPAIHELTGERGGVLVSTITLINTSDSDRKLYLRTQKFQPRENSNAPEFIPYEEDHSGLPEWMQIPAGRIIVPARDKVEVPITIAIPSDAPSGGQYGAVIVSDAPYDIVATNNAQLNAMIASLFLVTINGELDEKLGFLDFTSPQEGGLQTTLNGEFAYRVQNQGNIHLMPIGEVRIKDLFGRTVLVANANEDGGRVLPASTRTYQGLFDDVEPGFVNAVKAQMNHFAIGPVTAELRISYGQSGEVIASSLGFWVIPVQLLLVLTLIGAFVLLIIVRMRRPKSSEA